MSFLAKLSITLLAIAATGTIVVGIGHRKSVFSGSQSVQTPETLASPEFNEPAAQTSQQLLAASCRERVGRLRLQLGDSCAVVSHPPFALAGDMPASALDSRYAATIEPTCQLLKRRYFRVLPERPIAILMFSGEAVYRHFAERLFFDRDVSRFGYFKPGRRVVLVNLAEGDEPLRHELVHALMHVDFPEAPAWLREGMATMVEGTREEQLVVQASRRLRAAEAAAPQVPMHFRLAPKP